jgi:hypothetical protein
MLRLLLVAALLAGCRISLEDDTAVFQTCVEQPAVSSCAAVSMASTLTAIQTNVFLQCSTGICHGGAEYPNLSPGMSHASLVNQPSMIEPTRMLVVPNDPLSSYLMVMIAAIAPETATPAAEPPEDGYMPKGAAIMCCEKLDAIERWIEAGAPNN